MCRAPNCDQLAILAYEPDLHDFIERHVSHPEDAADLCQDVLVRAQVTLPQFKGRSHPRTWLLSIAHHAVVDYYRKQNIRHSFIKAEHVSRLQTRVIGSDVQSVLDAREQIERCVRCVMCNLLVKQQVAVLLCEFQGYSDKEAAKIMRATSSGFKHLLHQGRTVLKAVCSQECVVIAKTGFGSECARQRPVASDTKMRVLGGTNCGLPAKNGKRRSAHLLKLRGRLVSDLLFFDSRRADELCMKV